MTDYAALLTKTVRLRREVAAKLSFLDVAMVAARKAGDSKRSFQIRAEINSLKKTDENLVAILKDPATLRQAIRQELFSLDFRMGAAKVDRRRDQVQKVRATIKRLKIADKDLARVQAQARYAARIESLRAYTKSLPDVVQWSVRGLGAAAAAATVALFVHFSPAAPAFNVALASVDLPETAVTLKPIRVIATDKLAAEASWIAMQKENARVLSNAQFNDAERTVEQKPPAPVQPVYVGRAPQIVSQLTAEPIAQTEIAAPAKSVGEPMNLAPPAVQPAAAKRAPTTVYTQQKNYRQVTKLRYGNVRLTQAKAPAPATFNLAKEFKHAAATFQAGIEGGLEGIKHVLIADSAAARDQKPTRTAAKQKIQPLDAYAQLRS